MDEPYYSIPKQIFLFIFSFHSAVDIATIVPTFLVQYGLKFSNPNANVAISYLRLSRLLRLFRLFKLNRNTRWKSGLLLGTMLKSKEAIGILVFYGLVLIVLFASIMQILEGGVFTVNDEYPQGAYLRTNDMGVTSISPFISIPVSIYYTIITLTTVGYGDIVPVTVAGRAIACVCALFGILVLALPISIIGSNFTSEYVAYLKRLQEHRALHKARRRAFRNLWMDGRKISNTGNLHAADRTSLSGLPREVSLTGEVVSRLRRPESDIAPLRLSAEGSIIDVSRNQSLSAIDRFEQIYSGLEHEEQQTRLAKCWIDIFGIRRPIDIGIYYSQTSSIDTTAAESKSSPLNFDPVIGPIDVSSLSREELESRVTALTEKYNRLQERNKTVSEGLAIVASTLSSLNIRK
jgi:hypothetical protein